MFYSLEMSRLHYARNCTAYDAAFAKGKELLYMGGFEGSVLQLEHSQELNSYFTLSNSATLPLLKQTFYINTLYVCYIYS